MLACLAAFSPALNNGFVWDDHPSILDNPGIQGLDLARLRWMLTSLYMTGFQPLGWLAYALIRAAAGGDLPYAYHAASLTLHALTALSVLGVSWRLFHACGVRAPRWGAAATALFFAVHPLQTATVAWASQIQDQMAAFFFLSSVFVYLGGRTRPRLAACWLLFLASGLCRWKGICLPIALVMLDIYPLQRLRPSPGDPLDFKNRSVWLEKFPFFILAVLILFINALAKTATNYAPAFAPAQAARGIWLFLWKLLQPTDIIGVYALYEGSGAPAPPGALAAALFIAVTAWLWIRRRRQPALLALWTLYLALLAPPLLNTQQGLIIVFPHYAYLACLPVFLLAAEGIRRLAAREGLSRAAAVVLLATILGGWIYSSRRQTLHWKDDLTFWTHTLAVDQTARVAYDNLGEELLRRRRYNDAYLYLASQIKHNPSDEAARNNMNLLKHLSPGLKPDLVSFWVHAARDFLIAGHPHQAERLCAKALQKRPMDRQAHALLADILSVQGRQVEAGRHRIAASIK